MLITLKPASCAFKAALTVFYIGEIHSGRYQYILQVLTPNIVCCACCVQSLPATK